MKQGQLWRPVPKVPKAAWKAIQPNSIKLKPSSLMGRPGIGVPIVGLGASQMGWQPIKTPPNC